MKSMEKKGSALLWRTVFTVMILAVLAVFVTAGVSSATTTGKRVLLLVDADTAGTTALVDALTAAGNTVTRRPAPEYSWTGSDPALADFDCVIHLDGATYYAPLPILSQMMLTDFVRNGGGFIASQWDGYELAIGQQTSMPELVLLRWADGATNNCGGCYITYTAVSGQETHPVLAGVPNSFTFFADGHDAGSQVIFSVSPSIVLMTAPSGGPGVLVREFEKGRVVNFSQAANYSSGMTLQDPNIQLLYINAVKWAGTRTIEVAIDIKPGSYPNCFNNNGFGVIPLAVLGSADFSARDVDPASVLLESLPIKVVGKNNNLLAHYEDINADGYDDLVFQMQDVDGVFAEGTTSATLTGKLFDSTLITGTDSICIVP